MNDDLLYDWNLKGHKVSPAMRKVDLHDETLRDGIQCPSVHDPKIDDKKRTVQLLDQVGVYSVNVGLPGAGQRAIDDSTELVELIRDEKLAIKPGCAARTHPNDIRPIVEIAQATGVPIEIMTFLGSSPIRMYAEGWDEDKLEALTRNAVRMGVDGGCPVSFVTEDTVRSHPKTLRRLFDAAVEEGATRLVLCDTVGHSTPDGVYNLIHWVDDLLIGLGARDTVQIDWHGHNDRGFGLINGLAAIEAGADRVHGCVLGVGERVGNTSIDLMLVNLKLWGCETGDLSALTDLCELISEACHVPIPVNYPVFGKDAFRTGTGVHAAAVIKAEKRGDVHLSDQIYSGVPASWFGREQQIEIGHQSGMSNVRYWLNKRGIPPADALVQAIFDHAKTTNRLLEEHEVLAVIERAGPAAP
jgi:2-isopropylmalate synthase